MKHINQNILLIALMVLMLVLCLTLTAGAESYADDTAATTAGMVARVGEAGGSGYYGTLEAALAAAAEGDTVTVLADTTLSPITLENSITIDGGGHTVTRGDFIDGDTPATASWWLTLSGGSFTLENIQLNAIYLFGLQTTDGATLSLTDGTTLSGRAHKCTSGTANILLQNAEGASLTVGVDCAVSVQASTSADAYTSVTATVKNNGTLHIYGGIYNHATRAENWNIAVYATTGDSPNSHVALYEGGVVAQTAAEATNASTTALCVYGTFAMTGGTVTQASPSGRAAVYFNTTKESTITGGTITSASASGALRFANTGKLTVGGDAVVKGTGANTSYLCYIQASSPEIEVTGGSFTTAGALFRFTGAGSPTLTVSGGSFASTGGADNSSFFVTTDATGTITVHITGGELTDAHNGFFIKETATSVTLKITVDGMTLPTTKLGRFYYQKAGNATVTLSNLEIETTYSAILNTNTAVTTLTATDCNITATGGQAYTASTTGCIVIKFDTGTLHSGNGNAVKLTAGNAGSAFSLYDTTVTTASATTSPFYCSAKLKRVAFSGAVVNGAEFVGAVIKNTNTAASKTHNTVNIVNGAVTATFEDCTVTSCHGTALRAATGAHNITVKSGTYKTEVTEGDNISPLVLIGVTDKTSTLTITGGDFIGNGVAVAAVQVWGGSNASSIGDVTANIYNGYFTNANWSVIRVVHGAKVSLWGGVYENTATSDGAAVRVGAGGSAAVGEADIYGGIYYTASLYAGVFASGASSGTQSGVIINVHGGYTVRGGSGVVRNYGSGTGHTAYDIICDRASAAAPVMREGAGVRFAEGSSGLRFVSDISAESIAYLSALMDAGTELSFGTVIVPAAYAERVSILSTELLTRAGLQYIEIPAVDGLVSNADGSKTLRAAVVNIKAANIGLAYAAAAYVEYTVGGERVRMYSSYEYMLHSRSPEQVARMALQDTTRSYTDSQLTVLNGYLTEGALTPKTLDIFLIAGQSNASGSSYVTPELAASDPRFTAGFDNIYYSGMSRTDCGVLGAHRLNPVQTVKVGMGKTSDFMGAEVGMAKALAGYYNTDSEKEAAIIKYGAGGTRLYDVVDGTNACEGNWTPPSYLEAHGAAHDERSGALYRAFIALVEQTVKYYRVQGYTVTLKGVFWMQGESDRATEFKEGLYAELFDCLATDLRADLGAIFETDASEMPILAGEISAAFNNTISEQNLAFVEMQQSLPEIVNNVYVIPSASYVSGTRNDDDYHWTGEDMLDIGVLVGDQFLRIGGQAVAENTDYVAELLDESGLSLGKYTSIALAVNTAPAGATVRLLSDVTLYGSLNLANLNAVTLDGDGHTLTCFAADTAMRLVDITLTLQNITLVNGRTGKEAYGFTCHGTTALTLGADCTVTLDSADYAVYLATDTATATLGGATVTGASASTN